MENSLFYTFLFLFYTCIFVRVNATFVRANATVQNGDDVMPWILEDFTKLCPKTDTCSVSVNLTFKEDRQIYEFPCCGVCLCANCTSQDCCPDSQENWMLEEPVDDKVTECTYAQVNRYDENKYNGDVFEMIARCPVNYKDKDIARLCSRGYDEFDFNGHLSSLQYLPPVSLSDDPTVFKNVFCAQCHGFSKPTEIVPWEINIQCDPVATMIPTESISGLDDLSAMLNKYEECNILFARPSGFDTNLPTCEYGIDRCNITGRWARYDELLERACLSYTSIYKNNYKNVHCALCNGLDRSDVQTMCRFPPMRIPVNYYAVLLNFRNAETSVSPELCHHGTLFNRHKVKPSFKYYTRQVFSGSQMKINKRNIHSFKISYITLTYKIIVCHEKAYLIF